MVSCKVWVNFFNYPENRKDLINLVCSYFQANEERNSFKTPLIIKRGENSWRVPIKAIDNPALSNHKEAVNRLISYSAMPNEAPVIVAKGTEVLLLLIYAFAHLGSALIFIYSVPFD